MIIYVKCYTFLCMKKVVNIGETIYPLILGFGLVLLALEYFLPGFVSNNFSINVLLAVITGSSFLKLVLPIKNEN